MGPDERRVERRALLIAAGFELLGDEHPRPPTVRAVCAGARLNPRYFYESFAGLDDLVVAVYDTVVDQLTAIMLQAAETAPDQPEQTRAVIEAIVAWVDEDRRRGRVLYAAALDNAALNRRRIESGRQLADALALEAARRHGAGTAGQIDRASAAIVVGGFTELLVAWLDGRIPSSREELASDATALFAALGEAASRLSADRLEPESAPR